MLTLTSSLPVRGAEPRPGAETALSTSGRGESEWLARPSGAEGTVLVDEEEVASFDGHNHIGLAIAVDILEAERHRCQILPRPDQHWPHVQNFLACVKSRERCLCDIETGHTSTVVCHLGNISYKLGRKIWWDADRERVTFQDGRPDEEANALLGREYRQGYELPKVEPPDEKAG